MKTLFSQSVPGRKGVWPDGAPEETSIPSELLRQEPPRLPELSELDVMRHFTRLSRLNFSVDGNFYPLGSCTMKYNPRFTETVAAHPGFTGLHPLTPQIEGAGHLAQGALEMLLETERLLSEITGIASREIGRASCRERV